MSFMDRVDTGMQDIRDCRWGKTADITPTGHISRFGCHGIHSFDACISHTDV
jgi:hypothetical protein